MRMVEYVPKTTIEVSLKHKFHDRNPPVWKDNEIIR